jgi:hypothetical protein
MSCPSSTWQRWHQTLKNRILLENYYLPGELETQIEAFVADYNHLSTGSRSALKTNRQRMFTASAFALARTAASTDA